MTVVAPPVAPNADLISALTGTQPRTPQPTDTLASVQSQQQQQNLLLANLLQQMQQQQQQPQLATLLQQLQPAQPDPLQQLQAQLQQQQAIAPLLAMLDSNTQQPNPQQPNPQQPNALQPLLPNQGEQKNSLAQMLLPLLMGTGGLSAPAVPGNPTASPLEAVVQALTGIRQQVDQLQGNTVAQQRQAATDQRNEAFTAAIKAAGITDESKIADIVALHGAKFRSGNNGSLVMFNGDKPVMSAENPLLPETADVFLRKLVSERPDYVAQAPGEVFDMFATNRTAPNGAEGVVEIDVSDPSRPYSEEEAKAIQNGTAVYVR